MRNDTEEMQVLVGDFRETIECTDRHGGGAREAEEPADGEQNKPIRLRKLALKEFWDMYFYLHMIKVQLMIIRCEASISRWEQNALRNIRQLWEGGAE